jgi:hypothetical protein
MAARAGGRGMSIHHTCVTMADGLGRRESRERGNIGGFLKVADAMMDQGLSDLTRPHCEETACSTVSSRAGESFLNRQNCYRRNHHA